MERGASGWQRWLRETAEASGREHGRCDQPVVDGLREHAGYGFPVVADMDFGHTSPMLTFPVGCRAAIDAGRELFEIVEAAVL
jgi:muramoyltetrapeptide carboxypeptidase LdcA involved in peptidoglycan recycling